MKINVQYLYYRKASLAQLRDPTVMNDLQISLGSTNWRDKAMVAEYQTAISSGYSLVRCAKGVTVVHEVTNIIE